MNELKSGENTYMDMTEVRVTVEVFDHYKGKRYKDDSRCFTTSKYCLAEQVSMNYDDNVDNMKRWALQEALNAVYRGYRRYKNDI